MPGRIKTGRIKTRDVECLDCGKVFPSAVKNPQCGCGSKNVVEIGITEEEAAEKGKRRRKPAQMPLQALPFVIDSDTYIKMQQLMNLGLGKNYEEIIKKSIDSVLLMRTGLVKGGKSMEEEEKSVEEVRDGIKKRELLELEKKRMDAETDAIKAEADAKRKEASPTEKIRRLTDDDLERRMAEAQIKRLEAGSQTPLEQMMMMEYFKSSRGAKEGNPEVEELKRKLEVMEQERRFEDIRKSNDELKSMILDVVKSKTGDTQEGLITKMTQIFADRDKDMARLQQEIQSAKEETRQAQLDAKLDRIQDRFQQLQGGKSELAQFKDTFTTVKELAQEFGGKKEEKTGAQIAQELITSTIDKIQQPILAPLGEALADKARGQQVQYVEAPTQPNPGVQAQIAPAQTAVIEQETKQEGEYPDLVNISKENK